MIQLKYIKYCFYAFSFMVFISCQDKKEIIDSFKTYPTSEGNHWLYEYHFRFTAYDLNGMPSPENSIDTTYQVFVQINNENYALTKDLSTIQFISYSMNLPEYKGYDYYTNDSLGLLYHAYQQPTYDITPKKQGSNQAGNRFYYSNFLISVLEHNNPLNFFINKYDSIFYIDPPNKCLEYPLSLNKSWIYVSNDFIEIEMKIVDIVEIKVPAGKFECYKIKYIYNRSPIDSTQYLEMYGYYAKEGIIMKSTIVENIHLTDTYGTILYSGNGEATFKLKEYFIR